MEKHILRYTEVLLHLKKTYRIHTDIRNREVCGGEYEYTRGEGYITHFCKRCNSWKTVQTFPIIYMRCKKCMKKSKGTVYQFIPPYDTRTHHITDTAWSEECRCDKSGETELPF